MSNDYGGGQAFGEAVSNSLNNRDHRTIASPNAASTIVDFLSSKNETSNSPSIDPEAFLAHKRALSLHSKKAKKDQTPNGFAMKRI